MYLESLEVKNFRNIENASLCFDSEINIFLGKNAQGKTNLLEAIFLLSGNRSFRSAKDRELIKFGEERCFVGGVFEEEGQKKEHKIGLCEKNGVLTKKVVREEKQFKSSRAFLSHAPMTVFSPDDLGLIKQGPSNRRNYCDELLCTLFPSYSKTLSSYTRIVMQKNALLKSGNREGLDIWNERIAAFSASIEKSRKGLIKRLLPYAKEFFSEMTGGRERLDLYYQSSFFKKEVSEEENEQSVSEQMLEKLTDNVNKEKVAGACLYGAHRDDLVIETEGRNSKIYASQGQQRSAVLALLLAKTRLIKSMTGKTPIVLMDDVMSELDDVRRSFLLEKIEEFQVFITCCQDDLYKKGGHKKNFTVKQGKVFEKE